MANNSQEPGFYLTGEEFRYLDVLIGEIPTKYGVKIVDALRIFANRRKEEQEAATRAYVAANQKPAVASKDEDDSTEEGEDFPYNQRKASVENPKSSLRKAIKANMNYVE